MRVEASLPPLMEGFFVAWWMNQAEQYPQAGEPGIGYFKGDVGDGKWVDCLLFRNAEGALVGILNHYTHDVPELETFAGQLHVIVHHGLRRRGIASALLAEAAGRWPIDFAAQRYTPAGAALVNAFLARRDAPA